MNRLQHFLRAKTQFNLHSPFVYDLYTEVLFSRCPGRGHGFEDVVWRFEHHYGVAAECRTDTALIHTSEADFLVLDPPHRVEARWQSLIDDPLYQVTIDIFSVGIAVINPHLSEEHFILR